MRGDAVRLRQAGRDLAWIVFALTFALLLARMAAGMEERGAFAAAAEAIVAENNTPSAAGMLSAFGILVISLVMLRSELPRALAWLGITTGGLGIISEVLRYAAPFFYWGYGVLLWAWFVAAGVVLLRLARRGSSSQAP